MQKGKLKPKKQLFTLMLVPHSSQKIKSFTLSVPVIFLSIFIIAAILILAVYTMMENRTMKSEVQIYGISRQKLKKEISDKDSRISSLQSEVQQQNSRIKEIDRNLNELSDLASAVRSISEANSPNKKSKKPSMEGINTSRGDNTRKDDNVSRGDNTRSADNAREGTDKRIGTGTSRSYDNNGRNVRTEYSPDLYKDMLVDLKTKSEDLKKKFKDLSISAAKIKAFLNARPDLWPTPGGRLTSYFGFRKDPFRHRKQFHEGLDIAADIGTEVYAAGSGRVALAERNGNYGRMIIIDHGFDLKTAYGHLSKILVSEGDIIKKGQLIGKVGSSGRSTGAHLHFEIRMNNEPVDPLEYLD